MLTESDMVANVREQNCYKHTLSCDLCSSACNMVRDLWRNAVQVLASVARAKEVFLPKYGCSVSSRRQKKHIAKRYLQSNYGETTHYESVTLGNAPQHNKFSRSWDFATFTVQVKEACT